MQTYSSSLRTFFSILSMLRWELLVVGMLSMFINLLMLSPSLYMLQVYDRVMVSHNELTLLFSTLLLVVVLSVVAWIEHLRTGLLVGLGISFDRSLQKEVFFSSLHGEINKASANPLQSVVDLAQVRQFITSQGLFAIFDAPWFFIYAAVLFLMHPFLGYVGLFFSSLHIIFIVHSKYIASDSIERANSKLVGLQAIQQSQQRNSETVQALGMLNHLKQHWLNHYQTWQKINHRVEHDAHKRTSFSKFLRYSQQSLSLGAGAILVIQGEISAGSMIATNLLMTRMLQPLDLMTSTWRTFFNMQSALNRIHHQAKSLTVEKNHHKSLKNISLTAFSLSVKGLYAWSHEPRVDILNGVDLDIAPSQIVAILGPSGAGKTTLGLALLGLFPNTKGEVYWNNMKVRYLDTPNCQDSIGYLPQQVEFIAGTIAQNIARFHEINPEAVVQAATSAGAHEMILKLPKGYDTPIGPLGLAISSGQKQRIGLARALYGSPKLIVLDEPDSHLDEFAENNLKETFEYIKQSGCTIVLISHRKKLLSICDLLIFMELGRISRLVKPSINKVSV
jgi:ATP-binding cassette subfamily C exporter for protease/lipase